MMNVIFYEVVGSKTESKLLIKLGGFYGKKGGNKKIIFDKIIFAMTFDMVGGIEYMINCPFEISASDVCF